jgi:hypothetical protein
MKSDIPSKKTALLGGKLTHPEQDDWLQETLRHVRETRFGQVTLTIHQGEVIEVQKTEKRRFARSEKTS